MKNVMRELHHPRDLRKPDSRANAAKPDRLYALQDPHGTAWGGGRSRRHGLLHGERGMQFHHRGDLRHFRRADDLLTCATSPSSMRMFICGICPIFTIRGFHRRSAMTGPMAASSRSRATICSTIISHRRRGWDVRGMVHVDAGADASAALDETRLAAGDGGYARHAERDCRLCGAGRSQCREIVGSACRTSQCARHPSHRELAQGSQAQLYRARRHCDPQWATGFAALGKYRLILRSAGLSGPVCRRSPS